VVATTRITIPLDSATAKAYRSAPPAEKKKMQALVRLCLRDLAAAKPVALNDLIDEVSEKAARRGLTPKILEALLKGA
jgi:hypothetical protein